MTEHWHPKTLGALVSFKTGKLDSNAAVANGSYPFFTCSQNTLRTNTFSFDTECVLLAGNNANGIFPLKYFSGKFDAYQRTYIVRPLDRNLLSTKFLYYALRPKLSELRSISTGAATKFLTLTILNATTVNVPAMPIQEKIAGMLSNYDELVDNNERRIRTLEEMARSLYREWFVHFRFPGHENHTRVSSPLGEIPRGWHGILSDLASIGRASVNPYEYPNEQFQHFSIPSFDFGRTAQLEAGETILSGKYLISGSCLLLSKLNPRIQRIWLPLLNSNIRSIASTEFIVLQPHQGVPREFIYETCSSQAFQSRFVALAIGTSTSHQRVRPENVLSMDVIVPNRSVQEQFSAFVSPLHSTIQKLRHTNASLIQTRDLLLPRLLSGQVKLEVS
jgi:type I restriction enzyme S subunit